MTITLNVNNSFTESESQRFGTAADTILKNLSLKDLELLAKAVNNPIIKSQAISYLQDNL